MPPPDTAGKLFQKTTRVLAQSGSLLLTLILVGGHPGLKTDAEDRVTASLLELHRLILEQFAWIAYKAHTLLRISSFAFIPAYPSPPIWR